MLRRGGVSSILQHQPVFNSCLPLIQQGETSPSPRIQSSISGLVTEGNCARAACNLPLISPGHLLFLKLFIAVCRPSCRLDPGMLSFTKFFGDFATGLSLPTASFTAQFPMVNRSALQRIVPPNILLLPKGWRFGHSVVSLRS